METTYPPIPTTSTTPSPRTVMLSPSWAYGASFFIFGLLNNCLYVVILSAALDLVNKQSTPKGVILAFNIAPALIVKIGWPYFVKGKVQYQKRIVACSAISFIGILIVAFSASLTPRLLGISIASFSSGLGEMTYLQLATVYGSLNWGSDLSGQAVGWFSSGTGAAGLVGAGLWWILRGLGVRVGLLLCSILPLCMALTYYLLLPPTSTYTSPFDAYASLPFDADESSDEEADEPAPFIATPLRAPHLTTKDKMILARPLVFKYMVPLFFVYLAEYTINQGVAPTLLFEVPKKSEAPVLAAVIKSLRDYYPLWQLLYQTFVFFSRSSLSIFRLPPLPRRFIPLPTIVQCCLLGLVSTESASGFIENSLGENGAIWIVAILISMEGLSGGLAYVSVFYRLGTDDSVDGFEDEEEDTTGRKAMEKEFRIACVGFADTLGILVASGVGSALEPALCRSQVARGRTLCKQV